MKYTARAGYPDDSFIDIIISGYIPLDIITADSKVINGAAIIAFDTETGELWMYELDEFGKLLIENGGTVDYKTTAKAPLTIKKLKREDL